MTKKKAMKYFIIYNGITLCASDRKWGTESLHSDYLYCKAKTYP